MNLVSVVRFVVRYETNTRFISNPIRASFQGLSLEIYKYARQTCSRAKIVANVCWFLQWQWDSLDVEDGKGPYLVILGQQVVPHANFVHRSLCSVVRGNIKGTSDTVLHRLEVSVSCWKKQFFHESTDVRMSWAEVKINKRVESNTERLTRLTEHTLFLFFPLVPQNAPSCIWTEDAG